MLDSPFLELPLRMGSSKSGVLKRMRLLRLCFLSLVLFWPAMAIAQTSVEGTVRDSSGLPIANASLSLRRADGPTILATTSDAEGKFRMAALEAGAYSVEVQAANYFPLHYEFVLRPRQPLSLNLELQAKQTVRESVEVRAGYLTIDPEKTGSSYTFTRQDLDKLPEPLLESTNDLVNNLMPGASDSHDNFLAVRGTEFSLHEFINGVSFLDNTQPQFSPGVSPQIFETVDLMTGGFTPEYGNRFGGVLDITTRSGAELGGHGDVNFRGATVDNYDLNADTAASTGALATTSSSMDSPRPDSSIRLNQRSFTILARVRARPRSSTGTQARKTLSSCCCWAV